MNQAVGLPVELQSFREKYSVESLRRTSLVASLVVTGVALRILLADYPNFSPVGALALFAGASIGDRRIAVILPLIVMMVTDWMIGFHPSILWVYTAMVVYALLGMWAGNGMRLSRLVPATFTGSVAFFLITNLGFFFSYCPMTWQGLTDCYLDALPFFRRTLVSDILFSALFFSALAMAERLVPRLSVAALPTRDH